MKGAVSWSDMETLEVIFRFQTLGESGSQLALSMVSTRSAILGLVHRLKREEARVAARRLTDNQVRLVLERVFERKTPAEVLAKDFALSRNGILYLIWWVMNDLACAGPDLCGKAENADYGRQLGWPDWWRPVPARAVAA